MQFCQNGRQSYELRISELFNQDGDERKCLHWHCANLEHKLVTNGRTQTARWTSWIHRPQVLSVRSIRLLLFPQVVLFCNIYVRIIWELYFLTLEMITNHNLGNRNAQAKTFDTDYGTSSNFDHNSSIRDAGISL